MLLIITSTGHGLFNFINIDDLERPRTSKLGIFVNFFCDFAATHILRVNCAKWLEIDPDNLHTKFSALNEDFSSLKSRLPKFKEACARRHQRGVPPKKWLFYCYWLV